MSGFRYSFGGIDDQYTWARIRIGPTVFRLRYPHGKFCARRKTEPRQGGSAKGAARTAKRTRNRPAPHSVLREFLKSVQRKHN